MGVSIGIGLGKLETEQEEIDIETASAVSLYESGRERVRQGDLLEAAREFREAVEADPDFLDARFELARLQRRMGLFEESADSLERCASALEGDAEVLRQAAEVRFLAGSIERAAPLYEELRALLPQNEDVASAWIAITLIQDGPKKALRRLRTCLDDHPLWVEGFLHLGNLHEIEGRLMEAEEAYQRVLDLSPDHQGALENLGRLRSAEPLEVSPLALVYDEIYFSECRRLKDEGFLDRAVEWMKRWRDRHPHHPAYNDRLAELRREFGGAAEEPV